MSMTVLNVDDNDAGRYAISRILKQAGFEVTEAATGQEALTATSTVQPKIILLDVNLPDLNGFEVCRRIKEDPSTALIPVLMMSASFIRDKDRVRGLEGGADGYLTGPLEPDVLIATVNALLRVRNAEEELQHLARRWQTTFDAIADGVALLDMEGHVMQFNQAFAGMVGRPKEEIAGRTCTELWSLPSEQGDLFPCSTPVSHHRRESLDLQVRDRWFHITTDPVLDAAGTVNGAVCIYSDITERKKGEQELKKAKEAAEMADRAKDHFLAVLSHELRTPLTPVLTAVHALREEKTLPAGLSSYIDVIHRNVELEARLIDDLLDLTRIAREKLQLFIETLDAHALLRNVLEICREDIMTKQLQLSVELDAPQYHVKADSARLQQVFWNLLKNAVKFTPAGGELVIRSSQMQDKSLQVAITDSGIGIEEHILPRIFDAFEQGERSITRKFGGLGLGLAISKALVDMQGGKLSATSAGKDLGATFAVELPIAATPEWRPGSPLPDDKGTDSRSLRILIVDDHADTSRVMQLLLERRGYTVQTASTVGSALEAALEGDYDLLISDIGLPDGSGLDLMRQLQESKPIVGVALSGFGMEEDIQKSIQAGFVEHLTKPVNFKQLQEVIQRLTGVDIQ
jgi:PAS domain S-box-containing protein